MFRAVFCVALAVGVSACVPTDDGATSSSVELPGRFATPASATVVGAAVPLLVGPGPATDARYAQGWLALLRVPSGATNAYRTIARSAMRHGVALPPPSVACRRLPVPDQPDLQASEPGVPVTATTTTPVAPAPATRLGPTRCDGAATSTDGRTFVSARSASCWGGRCQANGYMVVTFRSTDLPSAPVPVSQDTTGRVGGLPYEVPGSRLLAATDDPDCGEGNLSVREVRSNPGRHWRRLTSGAANTVTTARMAFQGRAVRLQFNSVFGNDASYTMTSGRGLARPIVVIRNCG